ncbi:MAG: 3-hydroxyacyl-CoA dehydrogenase family protein [Dehalococcoidia bacterium]|nr:3-hydroxyacyl-CoA dehydrogenase family protein [Dehalococcoidia bacterium]
MKNVAVIGGGTMGSQIAELLSNVGGYHVMLWSRKDETVKRGLDSIDQRLKKFFVDKDKMSPAQMDRIVGRIKGTTDISQAAKNADFVIESVAENLDIKKEVFKKLDENAPANAILASNSSQLNITEMASATNRPDKVLGMHFSNPVGVMKLVEVVRGTLTSDETVDLVCALSKKLGKEPVVCKDFSFGFVANRAYRALRMEAVQMLWERVASPQDIDKALKLGYNLPMGPLELGDFSGAWGTYAVSEEDAMREMGPEKGRLHPLIRMMVRAGYTGGRHGKGIYAFWDDMMSKW